MYTHVKTSEVDREVLLKKYLLVSIAVLIIGVVFIGFMLDDSYANYNPMYLSYGKKAKGKPQKRTGVGPSSGTSRGGPSIPAAAAGKLDSYGKAGRTVNVSNAGKLQSARPSGTFTVAGLSVSYSGLASKKPTIGGLGPGNDIGKGLFQATIDSKGKATYTTSDPLGLYGKPKKVQGRASQDIINGVKNVVVKQGEIIGFGMPDIIKFARENPNAKIDISGYPGLDNIKNVDAISLNPGAYQPWKEFEEKTLKVLAQNSDKVLLPVVPAGVDKLEGQGILNNAISNAIKYENERNAALGIAPVSESVKSKIDKAQSKFNAVRSELSSVQSRISTLERNIQQTHESFRVMAGTRKGAQVPDTPQTRAMSAQVQSWEAELKTLRGREGSLRSQTDSAYDSVVNAVSSTLSSDLARVSLTRYSDVASEAARLANISYDKMYAKQQKEATKDQGWSFNELIGYSPVEFAMDQSIYNEAARKFSVHQANVNAFSEKILEAQQRLHDAGKRSPLRTDTSRIDLSELEFVFQPPTQEQLDSGKYFRDVIQSEDEAIYVKFRDDVTPSEAEAKIAKMGIDEFVKSMVVPEETKASKAREKVKTIETFSPFDVSKYLKPGSEVEPPTGIVDVDVIKTDDTTDPMKQSWIKFPEIPKTLNVSPVLASEVDPTYDLIIPGSQIIDDVEYKYALDNPEVLSVDQALYVTKGPEEYTKIKQREEIVRQNEAKKLIVDILKSDEGKIKATELGIGGAPIYNRIGEVVGKTPSFSDLIDEGNIVITKTAPLDGDTSYLPNSVSFEDDSKYYFKIADPTKLTDETKAYIAGGVDYLQEVMKSKEEYRKAVEAEAIAERKDYMKKMGQSRIMETTGPRQNVGAINARRNRALASQSYNPPPIQRQPMRQYNRTSTLGSSNSPVGVDPKTDRFKTL